jgi:tetratricopeptide (TPR) repeat protein
MAALLILAALLAQQPPQDAGRLYEQAHALFVAKNFAACEETLEQALLLDPKLVPALTLKAKLALVRNRFDVARESLQQALAAEPSSWYAHFLLGFLYHLQNDLPLALPALEKTRQLNPQDARPVLYLGLTQESLGHTGEAIGFYEEAVRLEEAAGETALRLRI